LIRFMAVSVGLPSYGIIQLPKDSRRNP